MNKLNRRDWLKVSGISAGLYPLNKPLAGFVNPKSRAITKDGFTRLSTNENPYGPSESVKEAIKESFENICRYPTAWIKELEARIAKMNGVAAENVVVTGGSREGLKSCGLIYGSKGGEIVAPAPTYEALLTYSDHIGAYVNRVPLDKNYGVDLEEMERRITLKTSLVFVCNPNNPTGTLLSARKLEDFVRRVSDRTMVFVDEVYFDYIDEADYPSMIPLVLESKNVIIARTFSKVYGLAGIRIGYMVARADVAQRIRKAHMAGTNIPALAAANAALDDQTFYKMSLAKNKECRQMFYDVFTKKGIQYITSHTNFVFFKTGDQVDLVQQKYRDQKVLIGRAFPPHTDWARISTGTVEEVSAFVKATENIY